MPLNKPIKIRYLLMPIAWIYGSIVFVRNKLFDWKILEERVYDVPIICVGNLTVGGTGKTPHTEHLVRLLKEKYRVAVLSRGYMRKSKGFVLADNNSTSREIGDEPYQIKSKYPEIILAVDKNRRRGIQNLLDLDLPPEVIILDDGLQHRYVKPSFRIILSNFNRPIYKDKFLPAGMLRDSKHNLLKADSVIITKCPKTLNPLEYRILGHEVDLLPYQDLYFTTFEYENLKAVFPSEAKQSEKKMIDIKDANILLVTAIASPVNILEEIEKYTDKIVMLKYRDHHNFKKRDLEKINESFESIESNNKIILITEKDASKLVMARFLSEEARENLYSLPIKVSFSENKDEKKFNNKILKHVEKNKRNRRVR